MSVNEKKWLVMHVQMGMASGIVTPVGVWCSPRRYRDPSWCLVQPQEASSKLRSIGTEGGVALDCCLYFSGAGWSVLVQTEGWDYEGAPGGSSNSSHKVMFVWQVKACLL